MRFLPFLSCLLISTHTVISVDTATRRLFIPCLVISSQLKCPGTLASLNWGVWPFRYTGSSPPDPRLWLRLDRRKVLRPSGVQQLGSLGDWISRLRVVNAISQFLCVGSPISSRIIPPNPSHGQWAPGCVGLRSSLWRKDDVIVCLNAGQTHSGALGVIVFSCLPPGYCCFTTGLLCVRVGS